MKQRIILFIALFVASFGVAGAQALTLMQENLIGLPNRFTVEVSDFAPDGALTHDSLRDMARQQLSASGLVLVPENSAPPIAHVQVIVVRRDEPEGRTYLLDVNVFNDSTLNTTYRLRKGTVWMIGSMKVTAGADFPKDVEKRLGAMLRYLVQDYFAANPNEIAK